MAPGLASTSLLLTAVGTVMVVAIRTRIMRPVGDNIIVTGVLLLAGLLLGLGAFYRGDRSIACKLSLGTSSLLLVSVAFFLITISSALRGLH